MRFWRVAGVLLLLMCLLASGQAEETLQVSLQGKILQSQTLSEKSLEAANQILQRLTLREMTDGERERAELLIDGKVMWTIDRQEGEGCVFVTFSDTACYETTPDAPDALMLLTGQTEKEASPFFSMEAYGAAAPEIYPLMDSVVSPKRIQYETYLENTAASPFYDRYIFSPEQMNALWPKLMQKAWSFLYTDGTGKEGMKSLLDVAFVGDVNVKRLYDRQESDLGIQLSGNGMVQGTERKISLTFGYTKGKGGTYLLSAKALKGQDQFRVKATLKESIREEKETYVFNWETLKNLNGEKDEAAFSLNLARQKGQGKNNLSGTITWEKDGKIFTAKPELTEEASGTNGTVIVTVKEKKKQVLQAEIALQMKNGAAVPERKDTEIISLKGMTQEEAKLALHHEETVLMRALIYLMDDVPMEDRWLLTHDLRTDTWMTETAVPVPEKEEPGTEWMIEEEMP